MKLFLIEVDLPVSSACPRIRTILWTTSCFSALCPRNGAFCGQHVLPNQSFDALYQVLTEYEHDISVLSLKSMYYRQGLFVDPTPEYGLRTRPFCILLYASIIRGQHVRSPLLPRRSAQGECLPECGTRVPCAHVRRNAEVWRSESLRSGHVRGILAVRHLTKFNNKSWKCENMSYICSLR